ncbi:hypothetical protein ABT336_22580 [Micromonospora sp. NPDC000207]|uniref:hypothetical protein n=1 Tax=Micromonospora sp. NPDC000207 TaxID=3154246 RepID=UPI0033331509
MSGEAAGRFRGALLFGMVLVTLLGGGLWWRASAPEATGAPPVAVPPELVRWPADGSGSVTVDPRSGRAAASAGRPSTYGGFAAGGYPWIRPVLQDQATITSGQTVRWEFSPGVRSRYVLEYRCTGSRALLVWVWAGRGRVAEADRSACDGSVVRIEIPGDSGQVRIRMGTYRRGSAEVRIQLVALPAGQRASETSSAR